MGFLPRPPDGRLHRAANGGRDGTSGKAPDLAGEGGPPRRNHARGDTSPAALEPRRERGNTPRVCVLPQDALGGLLTTALGIVGRGCRMRFSPFDILPAIIAAAALYRYKTLRAQGGSYSIGLWAAGSALLLFSLLTSAGSCR